jgi:hypothetical protein
MSSLPRVFLSSLLLAAATFAQDTAPAKPECNAENDHTIWPEKPGQRPGIPVEICTKKRHRYEWQQLTVDISRLRHQEEPKTKAKPDTAAVPQTADAGKHPAAPASQE